ncbi:MAG: hypothetical protein COA47_17400 [Robiginitomaculum sp.]|nr:MAG: hypothetical protein COA47_17400 [Robiginitomaculum sp.]
MSRKPIDQVVKGRDGTPRERVWKFIRGRKEAFTVRDISDAVKVNYGLSRPYLKSLVLAGYVGLVRLPQKVTDFTTYKFIKGPMTPPRVRKDGSPVTQGSGQENMWRSMKMLGAFSTSELAIASSSDEVTVSGGTASSYITMLVKAGYLRKVSEVPSRWVLLTAKRTGPLAPMVQRVKHVYDPNLKKVVWPLLVDGGTPPRHDVPGGRSPSYAKAPGGQSVLPHSEGRSEKGDRS